MTTRSPRDRSSVCRQRQVIRAVARTGLATAVAVAAMGFVVHGSAPQVQPSFTQRFLTEPGLSGVLGVVHSDPELGDGRLPWVDFTLFSDDGQERQLDVSGIEHSERLARLARRRVTVVPVDEEATGRAAGGGQARLAVKAILPLAEAKAPPAGGAVSGNQKYISIPCKFSDEATEPKNLAYFQGQYTNTAPGMGHYWREASYDTINIDGSTAINWVTLPQPRSYYVYDMNGDTVPDLNTDRASNDCIAAGNASVNYSLYAGINLMFNAELDGTSKGGTRWLSLDGATRSWGITWLAPWGYEHHGTMAHEMGHSFGLPHSYGNPKVVYDNPWDVMSDTWTACGPGRENADKDYGCLPQHTNAAFKDQLGWIAPAKKVTLPFGGQQTITMERLAQPSTANPLLFQSPTFNVGGSNIHFVVEVRRRVGSYDGYLPGDAVIIHRVEEASGGAAVMDGDGNSNYGDAGAQWTVGETFADPATSISVTVNSATASGFVVTMRHGGAVHQLTVTKTGAGAGTITSTPAGITCGATCSATFPAGINVQLAGTPAANSYLADWSGDCDANGQVTLAGNRVCGARFELLTLPQSVDNGRHTWTTTGVPWFPQSAVSHDGIDAAQSGAITTAQTSSLQTTVTGPVNLSFYWRIDAANGELGFYWNNSYLGGITGTTGWGTGSIGLPAGTHTIRWTFSKTAASGGADAAWVDEVSLPDGGPSFSDEPVQARVTRVKAAHIQELRTAIAQLRTRYSLGAVSWTDPTLTARTTQVKAIHITELRTALNAVYTAASRTPPTYTNPALVARTTVVTAAHIAELRNAVLAIW